GFDGFEPDTIVSGSTADIETSLDRLIAIRRNDEKTRSGVWRDLAVRHRRTEVDAHFLPIVTEAQRHNVPVPCLRRMLELIHDIEDARREFSPDNLFELCRSYTSTEETHANVAGAAERRPQGRDAGGGSHSPRRHSRPDRDAQTGAPVADDARTREA